MSNAIQIELPEDPPAYRPREELVGSFKWKREEAFSTVRLRLMWYTNGVGDRDRGVVETLEWSDLPAEGERFFEIRLPRAPYSFRTDNLSIHWRLEVIGEPGAVRAARELIVSPTEEEIHFPADR